MVNFPKKILVATRNKGKVRELKDMLDGLTIDFLTLADFEKAPEVIEDGATFEENALKKAREIFRFTGIPTLADDSGLCVDALDGRPGVLSARYAGEDVPDSLRYQKILEEMKEIPPDRRTARFVCVLALVIEQDKEIVLKAECDGLITTAPIGENGFGYDPIFLYEPSGLTFAQMDKQAKNLVSHRAKAMKMLIKELKALEATSRD